MPGSNVGMPDQPSATLPQYYQAINTYWVDPVTGAPVKVEQNQLITLKDSTGATRLVLFKADLKFSPRSTQSFVNTDRNGRNKITLVTSVLPLILLLAGLCVPAWPASCWPWSGAAGPATSCTTRTSSRRIRALAPH